MSLRTGWALFSMGLAFIVPSSIMGWESWYSIGIILVIAGLITTIASFFGKGKNDKDSGGGKKKKGPDKDPSKKTGDDPEGEKDNTGVLLIKTVDTSHNVVPGVGVGSDRKGGVFNPLNWRSGSGDWWDLRRDPPDWWTRIVKGKLGHIFQRFEGYTDENGQLKVRTSATSFGKPRRMTFIKPGYEPRDLRVNVVKGEERKLFVELEPSHGEITITKPEENEEIDMPTLYEFKADLTTTLTEGSQEWKVFIDNRQVGFKRSNNKSETFEIPLAQGFPGEGTHMVKVIVSIGAHTIESGEVQFKTRQTTATPWRFFVP